MLSGQPYLEPLVLQDSLDSSIFTTGRQFGLEHNPKGAIADNFTLGVLHVLRLASQPILHSLANHLC